MTIEHEVLLSYSTYLICIAAREEILTTAVTEMVQDTVTICTPPQDMPHVVKPRMCI